MGEEPRKEMSLLRRRIAWLSETAMTRKWRRHDGRGQDYGEVDGSEPQGTSSPQTCGGVTCVHLVRFPVVL